VLSRQLYGPLNETQLEYLNDILTAARHQFRLIKGLLELAKDDVGQSVLEPSVFSLADLLHSSVTMLGAEAKERQIDLGLQVDPGVDLVEADEGKVQEIVLNLLSNAVKYTPEGGRVALRARRVDDEIEVAISDTGIGIAPEDQENIFRDFWRVKQFPAHGQSGAGLGLALAQRFVTLHGGRIWVESRLGLGSTFRFTLPAGVAALPDGSAVRGPESAAERPQVKSSQTEDAAHPPRVLVVDDDAQAVRLVESVLRPAGYEVVGAANGREGLQLMRSYRPGLVILDLTMPGMDGFAVLDRVREDGDLRDLPVIVLTGETVDASGRARLDGRISQLVLKGGLAATRLANLVHTYYRNP
jgi:CheY-like chemotaxis protein